MTKIVDNEYLNNLLADMINKLEELNVPIAKDHISTTVSYLSPNTKTILGQCRKFIDNYYISVNYYLHLN